MWEWIQNHQYGILGAVILLGTGIYALINPSSVRYLAPTAEVIRNQSFNNGYSALLDDGRIGDALSDANRRQGIEQFGKRYVGETYNACMGLRFTCDDGEEYFFDSYGCGCQKLDFSEGITSIEQSEQNQDIVPVNGSVLEVQYGKEMRLRLGDTIELSRGDLLWIANMDFNAGDPLVEYSLYLDGADLTIRYPAERNKTLYRVETIGGDYVRFVDLVIQPPSVNVEIDIMEEIASATESSE